MRKAIGVVIVIYAFVHLFEKATTQLEATTVASLKALEAAAVVAESSLSKM